jgi:hypothetical protein
LGAHLVHQFHARVQPARPLSGHEDGSPHVGVNIGEVPPYLDPDGFNDDRFQQKAGHASKDKPHRQVKHGGKLRFMVWVIIKYIADPAIYQAISEFLYHEIAISIAGPAIK